MELAEAKVNQKVKAKKERSIKKGRIIERIVIYALLIGLSILFIFPFLWLLGTSLKPESEALSFPPTIIPDTWKFSNYKDVFTMVNFAKYYGNSIIVTLLTVLG